MKAPMDQEKREVFGKYEIGRIIGQGTFAKVYLSRDKESGKNVAIKVIHKDKAGHMIDQIIREISIMRIVRHPNIVNLHEVMATKSKIYLAMEYVKGGELFARVAKGRLMEDMARKYFQQLISAVDYCHSRQVSHRDLKPENLLLDENGVLKVSDFGLSALPENLMNDGMLHTRCGTPAYVAPEVLRKRGYDGSKADIWSCGVILYVLLAGYLPFQDENVMKMYTKVLKAEFQFPPWFSSEARRLISRVLVSDPERRITISGILRNSWFRKGLCAPIIEEAAICDESKPRDCGIERRFPNLNDCLDEARSKKDLTRSGKSEKSAPFFNAFEFISTMSSGFDLSSMFDSETRIGSTFTSRFDPTTIMSRIQVFAKRLGFQVTKVHDFKVRMRGPSEGLKESITVTAEIFSVAPEIAVVEFSKVSGDAIEYAKFCKENVRHELNDIVWTWQGG